MFFTKTELFLEKIKKMKNILTIVFAFIACCFAEAQGFKEAMDSLLNDKMFVDSDVSVAIYDLDDDKLLYEHRMAKMCRPASVLKLLTAGVALERLGLDYMINTLLYVDTSVDMNGISHRNLCLRGEMDPLFTETELDEMVASLGDSCSIDTLFVDCSFMDSIYWGPGWSWDDTPWEFQPYMSPLMLNGGCVDVSVKPQRKGEKPIIKCTPVSSYYSIANEAVSHDTSNGKLTIMRDWLYNSNVIRVRGNCNDMRCEKMNVFRSEQFFVTVMCEKFAERGVNIENIVYATPCGSFEVLYRKSRPVLDVVDAALKESNNLCAESLVYHLGTLYGHRPVSHKDGVKIIKGFLDFHLKMPERYEIADGSGLSLYTYLSADIMLQMLKRIYENKGVYCAVLNSLPISGYTGTLKGRMSGTVAERKIHAKTGTVSGICTLAGYADALNGHTFAFVIFNQGTISAKLARRWQNKLCELLCK